MQLLNHFQENGNTYMVYEFCENGPLTKHLSTEDPRRIIFQLSTALQQCYERKVIHRNITPDNIWLGKEGEVKLWGFDLAMESSTPFSGARAMKGIGSLIYVSPNDADEGVYGAR